MLDVSTEFKNNVYAPIRQFDARVTMNLSGQSTVYDDSTIILIKALEEMSVLNETIPSNEIQVTLDNSDGSLNALRLDNIQQIISSRPTITTEFGLVFVNEDAKVHDPINFQGKVAGSTVENPHKIVGTNHLTTLMQPSYSGETTQTGYDQMNKLDGITGRATATGNGIIPQWLFSFNLIEYIRRQYGFTPTVDWLKSNIAKITANWHGKGTNKHSTPITKTDFVGKVMGSTVENPHILRGSRTTSIANTNPATAQESGQQHYDAVKTLNAVTSIAWNTTVNGEIAQHVFSFNLIEHIKRKYGVDVPGTTIADKVSWLKLNIKKITCNWNGKGFSPGGNKANGAIWLASSSAWGSPPVSHTNGTISEIKLTSSAANLIVDNNGFVHFIAYADASNGTIASTIETDFIELEVELAGENKATLSVWNNGQSTWLYNSNLHITTLASITKISHSFDGAGINVGIDSNGFTHFIAYAPASNGIAASVIETDYVELIVETKPINITEWLPMGTYFLTDWKHQATSMTTTLTAHDSFTMLDNITFPPTTKASLYDLAVAVFETAGITKYFIDDSLKDGISRTTNQSFNCREMLQLIGIASQAAVWQDRNGVVTIKPFEALDSQSNYMTYTGQSGLYSGYSLRGAYPLLTNGAGMKNLTLENMYQVPEITLEPSIYQLIINVYGSDGSVTEYTYTNPALNGNNGQSFMIDNPLILSKSVADKVSRWFFRETNYNAIYKTDWRQNPALECADIVLVEDVFNSKKQTRIYKQEFTYEGYLAGYTESRGGI